MPSHAEIVLAWSQLSARVPFHRALPALHRSIVAVAGQHQPDLGRRALDHAAVVDGNDVRCFLLGLPRRMDHAGGVPAQSGVVGGPNSGDRFGWG